jgi:hypothetical protein
MAEISLVPADAANSCHEAGRMACRGAHDNSIPAMAMVGAIGG